VTHGRDGQIEQCVVVGTFALHAPEAEPLRGQAPGKIVGRRAPRAAELYVLRDVETERRIRAVQRERCEAERGEVRRLVDLDHGARRLVHELDGKQEVLAGRLEDRDVAAQPRVDRTELLECFRHRPDERRIAPRLRDAFEADMPLFAQPVERLAPEDDPVGGRRLRESHLNVARCHLLDARWLDSRDGYRDNRGMAVNERVTGLVLAAGGSSRLGRPKQLLPYGDATLLEHALDTAKACAFDQLLCVLGGAGDAIRGAVDLHGVDVVDNPDFGTGCSSSIAAALGAVDSRAEVLVLLLADQPGVTASTVAALLAGRGEAPLAACAYEDGRGHPLAFARSTFVDLAALHGDKGVWKLLDRCAGDVVDVPIGGRIPRDIDTWDDYVAVVAASSTA
jgi:molybdenum cofactor cytidylyltransferase